MKHRVFNCGSLLLLVTFAKYTLNRDETNTYRSMLMCAVCVIAGYLMSYWNRPFFPEWCSDSTMDDSATYDTMVRIGGSFAGIAQTFKAVADHYGWTHIVLLSNDDTSKICWYGAKPFEEVFDNNDNYTFTWLRLGSDPSDEQLDDILQQIRSRTRGPRFRSTITRSIMIIILVQ